MKPLTQVRVFRYSVAVLCLLAMGVILQPRGNWIEILVAGIFLLLALTLLTEI